MSLRNFVSFFTKKKDGPNPTERQENAVVDKIFQPASRGKPHIGLSSVKGDSSKKFLAWPGSG
jgi:hypothetical protein